MRSGPPHERTAIPGIAIRLWPIRPTGGEFFPQQGGLMALFSLKTICRTRRFASCAALLALLGAADATHAAAIMAADQQDGYAGAMLEKVSERWSPPAIKNNVFLRVRVSLDGRGRVLSCTPVRSSGYPALDISACEAVKATESYGTPPYSMPIDVYLAFWTGTPRARSTSTAAPQTPAAPATSPALTTPPETSAAHQGITPSPASVPATSSGIAQDAYGPQFKRYFSNVVWKLRNSIFIPVESKPGTYRVTVRLDVDTAGNIKHYDIVSGSGDDRLDKYVRQGIKRAGSIPPPPAGLGTTMDVTLTLTR